MYSKEALLEKVESFPYWYHRIELPHDITTPGWAIMTNLDTTNFVKWGFSTGVYGGRMEPGETAGPFRIDPALASLYMIADTAACNVLIQVLED